ncbi:allophanate hydrolase [Helicobacter sp. NHP19-012]|uniref:Allophanate hydrolase n=1 Tax=Helicobacter gastrofelis TaxID=2849642 RepID=A0ABM7SCW5_9HELI|nr:MULTISPECIES: 5-oxoprolinase subunit PxpB [unclassified Helicobacter]BCZ18538.1 allophanate hydrolase [Helicobacter sp. NHP19-012]GMB95812.1 5-oxoprolinase subunit PxpB [Helicobacter sp. NHP22-001]
MEFKPCAEDALLITLGDLIEPSLNAKVRLLCEKLKVQRLQGVLEIVPAYASLLVVYDPFICSYTHLVEQVQALSLELSTQEEQEVYLVEVPACYELGLDLQSVAEQTGLSVAQVIERHSGRDYLVYCLGFLPGFVYLGGLDPALKLPRLATPRLEVAAGSIGIANEQTGIYPIASPAGWHILAKTPISLYQPNNEPPVSIFAGDYVRYKPISLKEFQNSPHTLKRTLVPKDSLHA